jgi:uroporphyrinogen decarboxylase
MKRLLQVLHGEALAPPPVWLMRQAGRYLPEYRATRAEAGSFLDLCYTPELAEEVTLQPIRRFGFDASILFADILLVPHALGQKLDFVQGEGPKLEPLKDREALGRLKPVDEIDETLAPVYETVRRLSGSLPAETTLIGFAGAPWTVATYMIAGEGTKDHAPARRLMYADPEAFFELIDTLTRATTHYLSRQVAAGAETVMIFDSWASSVPWQMFEPVCIEPVRRIAAELKARHGDIPVIGFPRGAGRNYAAFARKAEVEGIGLDSAVPLPWARDAMPGVALQGNLDPMLMITGGEALDRAARDMVETMAGTPYVFNLGHGITPEADPVNVERLLRAVRG